MKIDEYLKDILDQAKNKNLKEVSIDIPVIPTTTGAQVLGFEQSQRTTICTRAKFNYKFEDGEPTVEVSEDQPEEK